MNNQKPNAHQPDKGAEAELLEKQRKMNDELLSSVDHMMRTLISGGNFIDEITREYHRFPELEMGYKDLYGKLEVAKARLERNLCKCPAEIAFLQYNVMCYMWGLIRHVAMGYKTRSLESNERMFYVISEMIFRRNRAF